MKVTAMVLRRCVSVMPEFGLLVLGAVLLAGPAAQAQERATLVPQLGHANRVTSVAFSSDGRTVLTGSGDNTAKLWDAETGFLIHTFTDHEGQMTGVAFAPSRRQVLTGSVDGTAKLWDAETGAQIRTFKGHSNIVTCVTFSPDGKQILTGSEDSTVKLWDVETGREIRTFQESSFVSSVAFSPDGSRILTGSYDNTAKLWDVLTGQQIRTFKGHSNFVKSVAFSPEGREVLTGSADNTAKLWDSETGQEIRTLRGHSFWVNSVAFSSHGKSILTGSEDHTAKLWDAKTGEEIRTFKGHSGFVNSVAISPDERRILTGSEDMTARLWNAETGEELRTLSGQSKGLRSATFSPDGQRVITWNDDFSAWLWITNTGEAVGTFSKPAWVIDRFTFSDDGRRVLTGNLDGSADLWDAETGLAIRSFKGHLMRVVGIAFSPDGRRVLTGSADKTAKLWDAETSQELHRFVGHSGWVNSVAFSPDGRKVLTGSADQTAKLWDAETGKELRTFATQSNSVESVAFSPDGRKAMTIIFGGIAKLWDVDTGAELNVFKEDSDRVYNFAFSADGRRLLTGGWDNTAKIWDLKTGETLHSFKGGRGIGSVDSVHFSGDGRKLLTGSSDDTAKLWDAETGEGLRTFAGHAGTVTSVVFSPDGRRVLTASADGTSKLWDAVTGRELCSLFSLNDGTWTVIDPEGRFDTNNLDGNNTLHWIVPDEPMRPLPLEIFMRNYYTPRLLARIMNGETLPPIRSIAEITNRVQPDVSIVSVSASKTHPGRADVVVHAASHTNEKGQASGLQNLHLFRNGQLVASTPLDQPLESGDFTFSDIQLPTSAKKVAFTAYAFNHDINQSEQIKSATTPPFDFSYEPGPPAKPRAFLLQIGVNHYQASNCELHGSVTDAEELSRVLTEKLTARGLDVKPVLLVSTLAESSATKEKIRDALQAIAAVATPDDVFFLSFSGHGYGDKSGQFYIFPSDVQGSCKGVDDAMLRQAISADELAEWLRPIDAGEMTFILDSCQSASSVEANDFKPGPMGSRGLGQLAYDKRMRILAASQSNQEAQERNLPVATGADEGRTQGLLSYALTEEGLVEGKADWKPVDQKITVGEWLSYAADAVPKSLEAGTVKTTRGMTRIGTPTPHAKSAQIPAVFDFSKKDTFVLQ